jgi:TolA-binding protein
MQVSSTPSASAAGASGPSSGSGNDIAALQRRLRELQQALKNVPGESLDDKAKQQQVKQLQTQIMQVQQQIEALMRERQQASIDKQREQQTSTASAQRRSSGPPGLGENVDVFA